MPSTIFDRLFGYDVFISYTRADSISYAQTLRQQLAAAGYRCFLDSNEMPPGTELTSAVRRALRRSSVLVVILSPKALASHYVRAEIATFGTARTVIPINIDGQIKIEDDDSVRAALRGRIWIDETATTSPAPSTLAEIDRLFTYVRRRVWRRTAGAAATTIVVGLGITAALYATASKRRSRIVHSQEQAQASETALAVHLDQGLSLAADAIETEPTAEARDAAVTALHRAQSLRAILHGHTDFVGALAYVTPATLVSSSDDKTVRLWDVAGRKERGTLEHTGSARALAGCAKDEIAAVGNETGTIEIFDTRTRARLATATVSESVLRTLQFDPSCKLIVIGDDLGIVSIWRFDQGRLAELDRRAVDPGDRQRGIRAARLDTHDTFVAVGTNAGTLAVFGLTDGKLSQSPLSTGRAEGSPVWDADFTEDDRIAALENSRLSVSTVDGKVQASDHFDDAWLRLARLPGDDSNTFVASGSTNLALVSLTGTVRTITLRYPLASTGSQPPLAMAPDGSSFATATDDYGIAIWSPGATPVWAEAVSATAIVGTDAALSPGGARIAIRIDSTVSLRDPHHPESAIASHGDVEGPLRDMVVSPDGARVGIVDANGRALLWTPADGTMRSLIASERSASQLRFSADGSLLAIASTDESGQQSFLGLWNVTRPDVEPQSWSTPLIEHIAFSPKNDVLALSSSSTVAVTALPVKDPRAARTFTATHGSVAALALSPDGTRLAIADSGGGIGFWSVTTLKPIGASVLDARHGNVQALAFSPDGKLLAATTGDSVVLWDIEAGHRIGDALSAPHGEISNVTFDGPTSLVAEIYDRRWRWSVARWHLDAAHLAAAARRIANLVGR